MQPETKYALIGDSMIAYQVLGDGPGDLVLLASTSSNMDVQWDNPACARQRERLASFSRLIMFDRRGTGLSDPLPLEELAAYEHMNDDVLTVMDAAGSERASLLCEIDGSLWGLLFAATYPGRTNALVLLNGFARSSATDGYPIGHSAETEASMRDLLFRLWGTEELTRLARPSGDEADWRLAAKWQRASLTPAAAARRTEVVSQIDVRHVLPTIQTPTLVLSRKDNAFVPVELGRYLADHIPGARFAEVPGGDILMWDESVLDLIEEFLTGTAPTPTTDRVLATVMFTDIVGSTDRLAELGDRKWRHKLDTHDAMARTLVDQFSGRLIKSTGDGLLVTFDGPGKAIRCARTLQSALGEIGIQIRAGLHSGEIELRGDDIGGLAVHIGARVLNAAGDGEIWCSRTIKDLVAGAGIEFADRGIHELKGVPDSWELYSVK